MGFLEIGCIYGPIMLSQYLRSDHVTFIWRACLDILPTRTALVRRTIGTNPFCEFCSAAVETEVHVFFECPLFSSVWTESPFHIPYPVPATNFVTGLRWLRDKLDTQVFLTGTVTLWNIWNFRNGYYHGAIRRGVSIGWVIQKFQGSPLPVVAEACAARLALQLAQNGWTPLNLEGDCLQVINELNDRNGKRLHSFGSIISACFILLRFFTTFKCSFIRRGGICLAHAFAHFPLLDAYVLDGVSPPADLANVIYYREKNRVPKLSNFNAVDL